MSSLRSVSIHAVFAVATLRYFKRSRIALAYLSIFIPGSVFAQAQISTPSSFAVSSSGAATYAIPIQVPPGTAGMQPSLALSYNSQAVNGLAGMGWSLSGLSAIHRCAATLVQDGLVGNVSYDVNDRFCLDGERLIRINAALTYGAPGQEYRTEHDGFTKIVSAGGTDGNPAYFIAYTKSGQIMEFGNSVDSRVEAATQPRGVVRATMRLWAINKISDRAGNYMTASYLEDQSLGTHLPQWIRYTGNTTTPTYGAVLLDWVARPDITIIYEAGSQVQTSSRLNSIKTYTDNNTITPVKIYNLAYEAALSSSTNRSRLQSISECDASSNCLSATALSWQSGNAAFAPGVNGSFTFPSGAKGPWLGDVNGDGRSDLLWNATNQIWYALGTTTDFAAPVATGVAGNVSGTAVVEDINGDGRTDFSWTELSGTSLIYKYSLSTGTGFAPAVVAGTLSGAVTGGPFLADVNGDGRLDALWLKANSDGTNQLMFMIWTGTSFGAQTSGVGVFANPSGGPWFGDINGDGRADVAWVASNASLWYSLSSGSGFTAATDGGVGGGPGIRVTGKAWLRDINQDGKADLVYQSENFVTSGVYSTGTGFRNSGWSIQTLAPSDRNWLNDINGDGKPDLVWLRPAPYNSIVYALGTGQGFGPIVIRPSKLPQLLEEGTYLRLG